jgi:hypothetical protein
VPNTICRCCKAATPVCSTVSEHFRTSLAQCTPVAALHDLLAPRELELGASHGLLGLNFRKRELWGSPVFYHWQCGGSDDMHLLRPGCPGQTSGQGWHSIRMQTLQRFASACMQNSLAVRQQARILAAVTCESLQRMDSRTCPMDTRAAVPNGLPNAPRMPVCRYASASGVNQSRYSVWRCPQAAVRASKTSCLCRPLPQGGVHKHSGEYTKA